MKKYFLILLFLVLLVNTSYSQRFGNEWIVYGQQYLKVAVNTNGIYRISKADLDAAAFTTTGKLLKNYQVFFRGIEMAVNVVGNAESEMAATDYIEFFGMANDGKVDEELYRPKVRPHAYVSLYSDETGYFVTAGTSEGKRMVNEPNPNAASPEPYFLRKLLKVSTNDWIYDLAKSYPPANIQSYYEPAEGVCSGIYYNQTDVTGLAGTTKPYNDNLALTNFNNSAGINPNLEALLTTRTTKIASQNILYNFGNGITGNLTLGGDFTTTKLTKEITTITGNTIPVNINSVSLNNFWSLYYISVIYPSLPIFTDKITYELVPNPSNLSRLQLSSAPAQIFGYDVTDINNQNKLNIAIGGSVADIFINSTSTAKKIFLSSTLSSPVSKTLVVFADVDRSTSDFLIITDPRTLLGANEYKAYRESATGGGNHVFIADTKKLYDQFCYGERSPIAIRRFVDYMTNTPKVIKYLFLIGKSTSRPDLLKSTLAKYDDFVPTFGFPASDVLLTSGLLSTIETMPAIPTGRITISSDQGVRDYLAKVVAHEAQASRPWQKNMMMIAGPRFPGEVTTLSATLEKLRAMTINSTFLANSANYLTLNKSATDIIPVGQNNAGELYSRSVPESFYTKINDGVGIINYFGHGTPISTYHNFGFVSKTTAGVTSDTFAATTVGGPKYTNEGKYPLLIANGCGIAQGFDGVADLASDWVNTPLKGAINVISQTYLSYEAYDERAMKFLYQTWFGVPYPAKIASKNAKTNAGLIYSAVGDIMKQSALNSAAGNVGEDPNIAGYDPSYVANLQQTMLLGDPSIAILKDKTIQALSLTLLDVSLSSDKKKNVLTWKTENEVDFKGFEIERSLDAKQFEKIGSVKSTGTSKETNEYTFSDEKPGRGINYYRLKMVDIDTKFKYSKIVSSIPVDDENELFIAGNPVKNNEYSFKLSNYLEGSGRLTALDGRSLNIIIEPIGDNNFRVKILNSNNKGFFIFEAKNSENNSYRKKILID